MHTTSRIAALAASTLMLASPAFAHATLTPASAANGATVKVAIAIPHGCDGAPTDTVSIVLPEGFVSAKPMVKAGWTVEITKGDYQNSYQVHGQPVTSGALAVSWAGGSIPDDQFDEFVVQGSLQGFDAETSLPFVVTQKCGAASVVWDQIAAPGENAHALEHPAPTLAVTTAAAGEHDHGAMSMAAPAAVSIGNLEISGGFSRATLPNAPVGGGYLTITNKGGEADRLVSAASPVTGVVQIHQMKMEGDLMKMNELPEGVEIPAGETVTLAPGGLHIMFMQLAQPLVEGTKIPLTLNFEKAGSVEVELSVESPAAKGPAEDHSMHGG
ncbi:hypothetical protein ASC89_01355 [Devosia sp. Root413D1]|uniref:DUF1775 domain-containing protein n=1 Tax=Devosia sp. Root413D1 TaxID=1736531 RepID=UPI0006F6AE60|nr:DUF1775 domain-containing protein [Devosia sp. Root413D1]KQW85754.1 hypothetical protein ASC89_01355 [Devosia sp. Root413D1]